jgi:hypothetical protein
MLVFDKIKHTYCNQFTGEEYVSVTTFLGKFKKSFDVKSAAERVAKREGKTSEEVQAEWKKLNDESKVYGSNIHEAIEVYNKLGTVKDGYEGVIKSYKELNIINPDEDQLLIEQQLWSHRDKLAGTADIIRIEDKGGFSVFDIKTNKKFNFYSQYNEKMLTPLSHLPVCEYSTYCLQLSLYAYMYQIQTGRNVNQLGIFYYERENNKFYYYPVSYMLSDIKLMLSHYGKN